MSPGAVIHGDAQVGARSHIGSGAVLYACVVMGEQCVVDDGAILGKRPRLKPGSRAGEHRYQQLVLEAGVTVGSGAILYAGARIGSRTAIGDQAQVRERSTVGADTVVGRGAAIEFDTSVGSRVTIDNGAYVTAGSLVEDDVQIGPGVVTTNDNTMGRHGPELTLRGCVLRRGCRIGGRVTLLPGVEVGEQATVLTGAVVTRNVEPGTVVGGAPARPTTASRSATPDEPATPTA